MLTPVRATRPEPGVRLTNPRPVRWRPRIGTRRVISGGRVEVNPVSRNRRVARRNPLVLNRLCFTHSNPRHPIRLIHRFNAGTRVLRIANRNGSNVTTKALHYSVYQITVDVSSLMSRSQSNRRFVDLTYKLSRYPRNRQRSHRKEDLKAVGSKGSHLKVIRVRLRLTPKRVSFRDSAKGSTRPAEPPSLSLCRRGLRNATIDTGSLAGNLTHRALKRRKALNGTVRRLSVVNLC